MEQKINKWKQKVLKNQTRFETHRLPVEHHFESEILSNQIFLILNSSVAKSLWGFVARPQISSKNS